MAEKFLYDPTPHGWAGRASRYVDVNRAAELAWLRTQWKKDPHVKRDLLLIAKQYKKYGKRAFRSWLPPLKVHKVTIMQAVMGIIKQGLV